MQDAKTEPTWVQALLYRWFVQYNPLYLLSGLLVRIGVKLIYEGLANDNSLFGYFAVGAVGELYAVALIAGAAVLTRLGLRRPAVCVALIAVLYQGDLMLCTEAYALFGRTGLLMSLAWLAVFVAKLHALARALHLRPSFSALAVPAFGALGIALVPHLTRTLDAHRLSMVVSVWLFALGALALWTSRRVESRVDLDGWGMTVLRRSLRATWALWALFVVLHVAFWTTQYRLDSAVFVPAAALLATRWITRERGLFAFVATTLLLVALGCPRVFQLTALMSGMVLTIHAHRRSRTPTDEHPEGPRDHYRGAEAPNDTFVGPEFVRASPEQLSRALAGSMFSVYLFAWTFSWSGGAWPAHIAALDLAVTAATAWFVLKLRVRSASLPLCLTYLHWAIQVRLLRAPQTTLQWGITCVATGFTLLLGSVLGSFLIERSRRADLGRDLA